MPHLSIPPTLEASAAAAEGAGPDAPQRSRQLELDQAPAVLEGARLDAGHGVWNPRLVGRRTAGTREKAALRVAGGRNAGGRWRFAGGGGGGGRGILRPTPA